MTNTKTTKIKLPELVKTLNQYDNVVLNKSALWVGNVAIIFMIPFVINNLLHSRWLVGLGSIMVVGIFSYNSYSIYFKKTYNSIFTLVLLLPAIMFFLYFSIKNQGIIGVLWSFPAMVSVYFLLPEK